MPCAPSGAQSAMRLVLDTNIVIAAVLGSGSPTKLVELAADGVVDLCSSNELLAGFAGDAHLLNHKSYQGMPIVSAAAALALITKP
jgi:hypothetical protein